MEYAEPSILWYVAASAIVTFATVQTTLCVLKPIARPARSTNK